MTDLNKLVFGSLNKAEDNADGTITVYGIASSEERDSAGEIILADAMRKAIPSYLRFPALREMHQLSAAGRTINLNVDDAGVTHIEAIVVDAQAIAKVKTKTYAGFSIGGKVLSRDKADPTIITGLDLREISLVDSPCVKSAALTMWKADDVNQEGSDMDPNLEAAAASPDSATPPGSEAEKASVADAAKTDGVEKAAAEAVQADAAAAAPETPAPTGTPADEAAKADDAGSTAKPADPMSLGLGRQIAQRFGDLLVKAGLVKAAKVGDDGEVEFERNEAGVVEKAADAPAESAPSTEAAKADEIEAVNSDKAEEAAKADAPAGKTAAERAEEVVAALEKMANGEQAEDLKKGMYGVREFANVLSSLAYVISEADWEADYENDGSSVPEKLRAGFKILADAFKEMAIEEVDEMLAGLEVRKTAKGEAVSGQADTTADAKTASGQTAAPHATAEALAKAEGQIDALKADLAKRDETFAALADRLEKANEALAKRLEAVEAQPLPPKTVSAPAVVTKAQDSAGASAAAAVSADDVQKALDAMTPDERAMVLTRAALANPRAIGNPLGHQAA